MHPFIYFFLGGAEAGGVSKRVSNHAKGGARKRDVLHPEGAGVSFSPIPGFLLVLALGKISVNTDNGAAPPFQVEVILDRDGIPNRIPLGPGQVVGEQALVFSGVFFGCCFMLLSSLLIVD